MSQPFKLMRGDLWFQADLAAPRFEFLEETPKLYRSLLMALNQFGLTQAEMKVEVDTRNIHEFSPGDWATVCALYLVFTTIRVKTDRVEVRCSDVTQVDANRLGEVVVAALKGVTAFFGESPFRGHQMTFALHGTLEGTTSKDFVSRFTANAPTNLGSLMGTAAIFYYGDPSRLVSSVTVDLSGSVENGLFVRGYTTWDASKIDADSLPSSGIAFRDAVLDGLGLSLVVE